MKILIDEYLESSESRSHQVTYEGMKEVILLMYKHLPNIENIAEAIGKWLYLDDEDTEFDYIIQIVKNIVEGKPVQNRFTGEVFN